MKQNNCKSENVRAGTRRQACRRVGLHCITHRAETIPLPLPIPLFHSFISIPLSHSRKTSAFATNSGQVSLAIKEIIATRSVED